MYLRYRRLGWMREDHLFLSGRRADEDEDEDVDVESAPKERMVGGCVAGGRGVLSVGGYFSSSSCSSRSRSSTSSRASQEAPCFAFFLRTSAVGSQPLSPLSSSPSPCPVSLFVSSID